MWLHEEHVWYALATATAAASGAALEPPLVLARALPGELDLVEQLHHSVFDARTWHAAGHDLWFVRDGATVAFMCWIFNARAPVAAAPGGWLELPPGTACLEDSMTAATHRGRGIAPRAWDQIAASLHERGIDTMITKVEVENAPSRRAVEKAGFVAVALQRLDRTGPRTRVSVTVHEEARGGPLRDRIA